VCTDDTTQPVHAEAGSQNTDERILVG